MKLHIGCGIKNLPGWKHLNIRKIDEHIDYVGPADQLGQFPDNSIEEIYACHLLEHFKRNHVDDVLKEWRRVLVQGGTLRIAVPNLEAIVQEYSEHHDLSKIMGLLYGGQDHEFNFHYVTFDFTDRKRRLEACGFTDIQTYHWQNFYPSDLRGGGYDDFSRAYLPHMDFEHGRLMSLNVAAKKI